MSIVGADVKNDAKRLKTQRLKARMQSVQPDLEHLDNSKAGEANFTTGQCLLEQGKVGQALAYLQTAALKCPDNSQFLCQLAKAELMLRHDSDALTHAKAAYDKLGEATPDSHNTLGYIFTRLGDHQRACSLFAQAVQQQPSSIEFRDNLARMYSFFGKKAEAITQYEAILQLNISYGKAHLGLADLQTWTQDNNHIARLEQALLVTTSKIEIIRIRFALAKENEDLNRPDETFKHLHAANTDFFVSAKFDVKNDAQNMQAFMGVYKNNLKHQISNIEDKALFIVGIPRTGTTLVDRILSAHSSVESAGELQSMPLAVKQASTTHSKIVLDLETIQKAGRAEIEDIGRRYLNNARLHMGANASAVFTDKLPLNFMYAGFILKALPRAKMICLRRNPMDTIWSNYKHLFAGGARYHTYSYDLMSIARFYLAYLNITNFWAQEFPDQFKIFTYEDIIADQRTQTENLLNHCGLVWEEGCMDFHSSPKAVATPSATQVRQPLYNNSIGKWKRYAKELDPVRAFFEENGVGV